MNHIETSFHFTNKENALTIVTLLRNPENGTHCMIDGNYFVVVTDSDLRPDVMKTITSFINS